MCVGCALHLEFSNNLLVCLINEGILFVCMYTIYSIHMLMHRLYGW